MACVIHLLKGTGLQASFTSNAERSARQALHGPENGLGQSIIAEIAASFHVLPSVEKDMFHSARRS